MTDEQKGHVRLWVAALRSGEFKQATDMLRANDRYCCLGVACEVYRRETQRGEWRSSSFYADTGSSTTTMPLAVVNWLGVERGSPITDSGVSFVSMNDDDRDDFATIANAIERQYLQEVD